MKTVIGMILGLLAVNNHTMAQNENSSMEQNNAKIEVFQSKKRNTLLTLQLKNSGQLLDQVLPSIINGLQLWTIHRVKEMLRLMEHHTMKESVQLMDKVRIK